MLPEPVVALAGMRERLPAADEEVVWVDFVEQAVAGAGSEETEM